jgi:hypothetical protein
MQEPERITEMPVTLQSARTRAHAHAHEGGDDDLTCHQVLEEAILDLFALGKQNGMTEDEIDEVMAKITEDRVAGRRKSFRICGDGNSS